MGEKKCVCSTKGNYLYKKGVLDIQLLKNIYRDCIDPCDLKALNGTIETHTIDAIKSTFPKRRCGMCHQVITENISLKWFLPIKVYKKNTSRIGDDVKTAQDIDAGLM